MSIDQRTIDAANWCVTNKECRGCPFEDVGICATEFSKALIEDLRKPIESEQTEHIQPKPEQNDSWQSALAQAAAEAVERYYEKQASTDQTSTDQTSTDSTEPIQPSSVDHPSHYQGEYECIDLMREIYGDEAVRNFCIINAYKYRFRAGKKQGETAQSDLDKADWYERYVMKHLWKNENLLWDIYKRELRDRLDENK